MMVGSSRLTSLLVALVIFQASLVEVIAVRNKLIAFAPAMKRPATSRSNTHFNPSSSCCVLRMGLLDSMSGFLQNRQGDFMKLDKNENAAFGPGPLLIMYKVPEGITNDEVQDMISDGAPTAFKAGVTLARITNSKDKVLEMSLSSALESLVDEPKTRADKSPEPGCPVLMFSGFRNDEMLTTYNILGREIFEETNGALSPACAMAVPNAMEKPLAQVLDEIAGDHEDAMASD